MSKSTTYTVVFEVEEHDFEEMETVEVSTAEVPAEASSEMVAVDKAAKKSPYTHVETLSVKEK